MGTDLNPLRALIGPLHGPGDGAPEVVIREKPETENPTIASDAPIESLVLGPAFCRVQCVHAPPDVQWGSFA